MYTEERIGSLRLLQSPEEFRLGQDSLLLAAFAHLRPGGRVCDLGCGVGSLLLALAARTEGLTLDGVELREHAAALCRENLVRNALAGAVVTGDLKDRHPALPWSAYDLVVSNPPYFPAGAGKRSPDEARRQARTESDCTLAELCAAAGRLCKNGGRFALCIRPERLAELFAALAAARLEPKRLQLVQSAPERAPKLALVEAMRGRKPGLRVQPTHIER